MKRPLRLFSKGHKNEEKKTKQDLSVNNVELQKKARQLICRELRPYIDSADKRLSQLDIWYIRHNTNIPIDWEDKKFKDSVLSDLAQERVTAVKSIETHSISEQEIREIESRGIILRKVGEDGKNGQLEFYISFQNISDERHPKEVIASDAWLICTKGKDAVYKKFFHLNPEEKTKWHIGRMKNPSSSEQNDIDIKDEFESVSRRHAVIYIDNGRYKLRCKDGGVYRTFWSNTDGNTISLDSEAKEIPPLCEGDKISLSDKIVLQFTYINPKDKKK